MPYQFSIIVPETQKVLSIRTKSSMQELPEKIGEAYQEIFHYMMENNENPSGDPFVGYFNMDMNNLDVEIGYPIGKTLPDRGNIKMSEIPSGRYASTVHTGPYKKLELAYNALTKWMDENNHKANGTCYEVYLNDPVVTPEDELQTKIMMKLSNA